MNRIRISLIVSVLIAPSSYAATCSCASVPLVNSMQAGATDVSKFVFSISYEKHVMNDLVAGSRDITDETGRKRSSDAVLLELGYGFSTNWSVSVLSNYIEHKRQISISGDNKEQSQGLGDSIVLFKYVPTRISVFNSYEWGVGAGVKFGTGKNSIKNELGVRLSEDMQPSSGNCGYILWGYYAKAFSREARNTIHVAFNGSFNVENDQEYKIGDDVNLSVAWQSLLSDDWRVGLGLNWREANGDERSGGIIPNTGGEWLDLNSTVQYRLNDDLALRASYRHPVKRNLSGSLQFTTSYAWNMGVVMQF